MTQSRPDCPGDGEGGREAQQWDTGEGIPSADVYLIIHVVCELSVNYTPIILSGKDDRNKKQLIVEMGLN